MGIILWLVGIAGAGIAAYGAWQGFVGWVSEPRVQAQIAADQKVVDESKRKMTEAQDMAARALSDTQACLTTSDRLSKATEDADRRAKVAQAEADAMRRKQKLEEAAAAPRIADLQARAAAAPKLMACTDELRAAKLIMVNSLRAKRGLPPLADVPPDTPPLPALVK